MSKIRTIVLADNQRKFLPPDEKKLPFGAIFSDHMFKWDYRDGGWQDPRVEPNAPLAMSPAAMVLHYGQAIFEGLKCYRHADGRLALFRPKDNFKRLTNSAKRICIPSFNEKIALEGLKELIKVDARWVPKSPGTSLYIRPTIVATEPALGVRAAKEYLFFTITGPVGPYFANGFNPTRIYVEEKMSRAAKGGLGEAKTAANYAASLYAAEQAHAKGFDQMLWLDAAEHKYVEEVGAMNMFFVIDDVLITSKLQGTVLPGITRRSVIEVAKSWGMKVEERDLSIDEIIAAQKNGKLGEAFGSGTAAVISPVGLLSYKGKEYTINKGKVGGISQKIYDEIVGIQTGAKADKFGWIEFVE